MTRYPNDNGFLSTGRTKSDLDYWKTLGMAIGYLKGTITWSYLFCVMRVPQWSNGGWAHPMCFTKTWKSHTGVVMNLTTGGVYSKSSKQRSNKKSSTESELVAASDMSREMLLTIYFLSSWGCSIQSNQLFPDNKTTILLEKNVTISSTQRTRHIRRVRYFFIKDKVDQGE